MSPKFLTLALALWIPQSKAQPLVWKKQAQKLLESQVKQSKIPRRHFSLWIKKGTQVASINSNQLFTPASLSKIPTALAFLDQFPLNHHFYTWVYKKGQVSNGLLKGDIYLKGGGDPTLITESMVQLVHQFLRTGIEKIEGHIYVDDSEFDAQYYPTGRQNRRVDRAYDAPVNALSFNWNTTSIYIRPGLKRGEKARIYLDPPTSFLKIINKTQTTRFVLRPLRVLRPPGEMKLVVTGKLPLSSKEKVFFKSIESPDLWTGLHFKYFLEKAGVQVVGNVLKGRVPLNLTPIATQKSRSLREILISLMKFSNNFVAEVLTKHLGQKKEKLQGRTHRKPGQSRAKSPGAMKEGVNQIRNFLYEKGWRESDFVMESPSGFSRKNKIRADLLGQLLEDTYKNQRIGPEFLSSLPISGIDGTLKKRMKISMKGKIRAKTGHLSGVTNLAGFLSVSENTPPLVFVLLYNGPQTYDWKAMNFFEKLLWRVYNLGIENKREDRQ